MDSIPTYSGSYVLWLALPQAASVVVGRLGVFDFPPGDYLYMGSAHGPGGLRARLRHHMRVAAHPHWHIDWLRTRASLRAIWYSGAPEPFECQWSQALGGLPAAQVPVRGFGAADCSRNCPAHLIAFPDGLPVDQVEQVLRSTTGDLYRISI